MKRIILIGCLFSFVLIAVGQTELDLNISAGEKLKKTETELKTVYQKIVDSYSEDTLFIQKLTVSQQVWKEYKSAQLEMKFPNPDKQVYGSIYPVCSSTFLEKITNERITFLKHWLESPPEGDGCLGSRKVSLTD